jgi:O-antigen/teichoic acid export membrane protein
LKAPFKLKLNVCDVIYNQNISKTLKSGFLILCSGLVIVGLKSFDRILIANYYSKIDFALYAFSYSLIVIFVMIFSSINNLLLKHSIESNIEDKIAIESNIYSISILISLLITVSYFIIENLIFYILPQYIGSIDFFKILSLSIVPTILINLLQFNYFKIENKEKMFFMTSILFLFLAISFSYLFALASKPLSYQAYIKVGVFWGWFFFNEWLIGNKLKYMRKQLKNKYLILLLILFIQLIIINIWN